MIAACITGRLVRDAEVKHVDGNVLVAFSVASKRFAKGAHETDFVDCAMWGRRGESLASHLVKGTSVAVRGGLGLRKFTTRDGRAGAALELRVDDLDLLGGKSTTGPAARAQAPQDQGDYDADADTPF